MDMDKIRIKPTKYTEHDGREILYYVCKASDEDISEAYERSHEECGQIAIEQLGRHMSLVNEFESLSEAARQTGVDISDISKCINNKRQTAGGFRWRKKK